MGNVSLSELSVLYPSALSVTYPRRMLPPPLNVYQGIPSTLRNLHTLRRNWEIALAGSMVAGSLEKETPGTIADPGGNGGGVNP